MQVRLRIRATGFGRFRITLLANRSRRPRFSLQEKRWRRGVRVRVPLDSLRAAAVAVLALFVVAPVSLTLISAHGGLRDMAPVSELVARLASPLKQIQAHPEMAALHSPRAPREPVAASGAGSVEVAQTSSQPISTTSTSNKPALPSSMAPSLDELSPDKPSDAGVALFASNGSSPEQAALTTIGSESTASTAGAAERSPERAASRRLQIDPSLRDRFMWRAWLESSKGFLSPRAARSSLLVYREDGGYSVVQAAYRPPIQRDAEPLKPGENPDNQGDQDQRQDQRLERPERWVNGEPQYGLSDPRDPQQPRGPVAYGTSSGARSAGHSFQPWDPQIFGDTFGPANALVSRVPGLRIDNVTLFQGYSSNSYPFSRGFNPVFGSKLGYDIDFGAAATFSWSRMRPTNAFYLVYTPSHVSRVQFPEWNTTDHRLGIRARKQFARWEVSAGSDASVRGLDQVLFTPPVLRQVVSPPATMDELLEAAKGGQLTSDEIASVLTGSPVVEKQSKTNFDLSRVLSTSANVGLSYSYSPRLSVHVGLSANRFQALSHPPSDDKVIGLYGLYRSTSVGGDVGMSYQLGPGTSIGVETNARRNFSGIRNTISTNTIGSVTQRVGRRWTVSAGAGVGTVDRYTLPGSGELARQEPTWVVDTGLHYTGRAHHFSASASRRAGDTVGLGARVSRSAGAEWSYMPPGSPWGLFSVAQWYDMSLGVARQGVESNMVGGGVVRQLSPETSITAQYSYQSFRSPFRGIVSNLSGNRVQMSWVWRPREGR